METFFEKYGSSIAHTPRARVVSTQETEYSSFIQTNKNELIGKAKAKFSQLTQYPELEQFSLALRHLGLMRMPCAEYTGMAWQFEEALKKARKIIS